MSNWQYLPPYGVTGGATSQGGAGGYAAGMRDDLDAIRSGVPRAPYAEYPDGYLGTITDRREDKLLDAVQKRLTNRSYQRGVHKGERIEPTDYFWPKEFGPQTGLELQARGQKFTAKGNVPERLAHLGKVPFTSPEELGKAIEKYDIDPRLAGPTYDPIRSEQLRSFRPPWV